MEEGKHWEQDFQKSFVEQGFENKILRLYDTTNGFKGITNICDFVYYSFPIIGFFELKSTLGPSLSFDRITESQWSGLLLRAKEKGAMPAILIQYRDFQKAYLVHINALKKISDSGKKSINIKEAEQVGLELRLLYKRTRCRLDCIQFIEDLYMYWSKTSGIRI